MGMRDEIGEPCFKLARSWTKGMQRCLELSPRFANARRIRLSPQSEAFGVQVKRAVNNQHFATKSLIILSE
jgi:hypothetical protein